MRPHDPTTSPLPDRGSDAATPCFESWSLRTRAPDYRLDKPPIRTVAHPELLWQSMRGQWSQAVRTGITGPVALMLAALGALSGFWLLMGV